MCDNVITLYFFMFFKIVILIILPIIIIIKRKKDYFKILIIVNIVLLLILLICNVFTINKCIYNSTLSGVQRTKNKNKIDNYLSIHPANNVYTYKMNTNKNYKTISGKNLYYYNLNNNSASNSYYECNGNKIYLNTVGSGIGAFSTAISTLYNNEVDPIKVFEIYKSNNKDICNKEITVESIYDSVMKVYGGIKIQKINSYEVESALKNDALVIAHISANKNSRLTCDNNYIVIYNIGLDGKYMIADPLLRSKSYVCPYSSRAYGNVISSENMNNSWSLNDINTETVSYYMVKKG